MPSNETIKNNILIAEFLGYEIEETLKGQKVFAVEEYSPNDIHRKTVSFYSPNELRFHEDWNWILQAAVKSQKTNICDIGILMKGIVVISYNGDTKKYFSNNMIGNLNEALVDFIKWHNSKSIYHVSK